MNKTNIAWTDYTWNPITGCSPISEGCQNCYAAAINKRFHLPQKIQFHSERLEEPLKRKKPSMIFTGSMTDIFHEDVPDEWIGQISRITIASRQHTFQILTKRIDRAHDFYGKWSRSGVYGFSDNVWLGVTIEHPDYLWRAKKLFQIPAAVRFVSLEPLLWETRLAPEMYEISDADEDSPPGMTLCACGRHWEFGYGISSYRNYLCGGIDWVIVGAETGPGRRPCKLEWVRSIINQCHAAGVPCFVKQIEIDGKISHDMNEWPEDLRVRQWPKVKQ